MQNINLHNYQDFLLRYIDEELDLRQTEALLAFVAVYPAIAEELESLQSTKLDIETIACPNKAVLYKNIFPVIVEPTTIVYPNKQQLFKKEKEKAPVVFLRWWAVGAAAIFIFMVARYGMFNEGTGGSLSKNNISKSSVVKAGISSANNTSKKNTSTSIAIENNESLASTNIVANQQNIATNTLVGGATQEIPHTTLQTAYTIPATETTHSNASYTGDIIDVKPTIIAEITVPSITGNMTGSISGNEENSESIEAIDTEAASSNRSVMVGAFEIDKDKFRGLFRKANALFKNKENNKNEK